MVNEAFGWAWVLMGFLTGGLLGMGFAREGFLGGYDSWERRLLRLGHISLVGLGVLNILAAGSLGRAELPPAWAQAASVALIVGGVLMPVCCGLAAWDKRTKPLFAAPVIALTLGVGVLVVGLCRVVIG
ncbi:MAG: hypothetical protein R3B57_05910 [Phycisphaerales bacterium]